MYSQNDFIFSVMALINFLFNSYIFVYVFSQKIKTNLLKAFLLESGFISLWALADYLNRMPIGIEYKQFIVLFSQLFFIPTGLIFMNIIYIFTKRKYDYLFYSVFVIDVIFAYLGFTQKLIISDIIATSYGTLTIKGYLFKPFLFFCEILPCLISLFLLIKKRDVQQNSKFNKAIIYIAAGAIASVLFSIMVHYIIPELLEIDKIVPSGSLNLIFFPFSILLVIFNYDLIGLSSNEALTNLISDIYDGIIVTDDEGIISHINKKASNLLGIAGITYKFKLEDILLNYKSSTEKLIKEHETTLVMENYSILISYSEIKNQSIFKGNLFILKKIDNIFNKM